MNKHIWGGGSGEWVLSEVKTPLKLPKPRKGPSLLSAVYALQFTHTLAILLELIDP